MNIFPVMAMTFIMNVVGAIFIICCLALILIILIQKGRGGGLSAAFGGGMAGGVLGSKTGDFLTWVTIVLVGIFLMLALIMAKYYKPTASDFGGGQQGQTTSFPVQQQRQEQPAIPSGRTDLEKSADVNSRGG